MRARGRGRARLCAGGVGASFVNFSRVEVLVNFRRPAGRRGKKNPNLCPFQEAGGESPSVAQARELQELKSRFSRRKFEGLFPPPHPSQTSARGGPRKKNQYISFPPWEKQKEEERAGGARKKERTFEVF